MYGKKACTIYEQLYPDFLSHLLTLDLKSFSGLEGLMSPDQGYAPYSQWQSS